MSQAGRACRRRGWLLAAALVATAAGRVTAQDAKPPARAPKVIQLEEVKIEGRVQKPNAFYILNRSNLGYEVMELRTRFADKIVSAVGSPPF